MTVYGRTGAVRLVKQCFAWRHAGVWRPERRQAKTKQAATEQLYNLPFYSSSPSVSVTRRTFALYLPTCLKRRFGTDISPVVLPDLCGMPIIPHAIAVLCQPCRPTSVWQHPSDWSLRATHTVNTFSHSSPFLLLSLPSIVW